MTAVHLYFHIARLIQV